MNTCEEEQFKLCQNNSLCHLCDGHRLFKKSAAMIRKEKEQQKRINKRSSTFKRKPKEGIGLEKDVVRNHNKASNIRSDSAKRRPGSGNIWSMPGDVVLANALKECKERGTTTGRGEKTISIHKDWLDKVKSESAFAKKDYWSLAFRYKGDEEIFVIMPLEQEIEMLEAIRYMKEQLNDGNRGTEQAPDM